MKAHIGFESLTDDPQLLQNVATIVVLDDFGNPIWALQKLADGAVFISSARDSKFRDLLKSMGVGLRAPEVKVIDNGPKSV